jgi:HCOMODA/2-hydroxy-3-carboxy-muconic semialdehyde decarboxylase
LHQIEGCGQAANPAGTCGGSALALLAAANRILVHAGVLDCYGHASMRHPDYADRYLLARALAPELVEAADIMVFDLDSRPVDGGTSIPYQERFIHGEIYKARPEVHAIIHSHAPSLLPFCITDVPLRAVYHLAAFIAEGVPLFDASLYGGAGHSLVNTAELGQALAGVLGDKPVALLRGHGVVVVGAGLPMAVGRSVYLQINAKLQMQAVALGGRVDYLQPAAARPALAFHYQRAWQAWLAQAGGVPPGAEG